MTIPQNIVMALLLIPLVIMISYMDIRYRRIPNKLVLAMLLSGLTINTIFGGSRGLLLSLGGLGLSFGIMLLLHLFGTMGAGDVKLFAAIGAVNGLSLVIPTLLLVALTGGVLAIFMMVYSGRVRTTMFGVLQFFYGLLPGQRIPRFEIPTDRKYTLPYAVPICLGSLASYVLFHHG
jgi:prepilin peptidase CpaA